MKKNITFFMLLFCITSLGAFDTRVNGFVNATLGKSDNKETSVAGYGNTKTHGESNADKIKFQPDSLVGVQVDSTVSDNFSATVQLTGRFENEEAKLNVEWAYITYDMNDNAQVQIGRYRPAIYMYSNTLDVAYSYLWVRVPIEVYRPEAPTYLDGVNLVYRYEFENELTINAKAYYGNKSSSAYTEDGSEYKVIHDNVYGAELIVGNDYVKLRGGLLVTTVSGTFAGYPVGDLVDATPGLKLDDSQIVFYSLGFFVNYENFIFQSEITYRDAEPSLVAEKMENYYLTFAYILGDFTPNITYASLDSTIKPSTNPLVSLVRADSKYDQYSITTGLRYEINPSTALKLEWMRTDQKQLEGAVDNTVTNLYSVALNLVF